MNYNAKVLKKLIVGGALVLLGFCQLQGQFENLRLGLQVSPAISWMSTNSDFINRTGSNVGIGIGAVAEYYFAERFAATGGVGLNFARGGTLQHEYGGNLLPDSELSDDALNTGDKPLPDGVKIKYRIQYLEFPFGLKYRSAENGYLRYFAEFPIISFGFRTAARGDITGREVDVRKENISPDVSRMNVSWGIGAGVEYALSENTSLVGGLYFNGGLVDVTNDNAVTAIDNPDQSPSNPNDDYIFEKEDSRGKVNSITLRVALLF